MCNWSKSPARSCHTTTTTTTTTTTALVAVERWINQHQVDGVGLGIEIRRRRVIHVVCLGYLCEVTFN